IRDLQQMSRMSHENFHELLLPVIRNYAAFVHLLPASEEHHHCEPGGLFRHGLEVAYNATMKCEAKVFAMECPPDQRRHLELRWKTCAMLGGLLHDIGKPVIDVGAIDESGMLRWDPHVEFMTQWLESNKLPYYYITWHTGERHLRHLTFNTMPI